MSGLSDVDIKRMRDQLFFEGPERNRRLSRYWLLLPLAAVIASAGVVSDSTATVIGAMIVAPLMTPILGIVLAVVLADGANLDLAIRWDLPDHGASYRTTLHNGVLTHVKDSDKQVGLTLTIPAAALIALAQGNLDAARSSGLTASGDESQLASLFSVLQPGDPGFNIVEP
jgi:alkyl sulfatase BDS1-like metallo-beta-lactamase superfamily hydrolase